MLLKNSFFTTAIVLTMISISESILTTNSSANDLPNAKSTVCSEKLRVQFMIDAQDVSRNQSDASKPVSHLVFSNFLRDGQYILTKAPTMCGQQLLIIKHGKISFEANSFQLPFGEYRFINAVDQKSNRFSIKGGPEEHLWYRSLHRVRKTTQWPSNLDLDGLDLTEGQCLYKAANTPVSPPSDEKKFRVDKMGRLVWDKPFLLPGKYLAANENLSQSKPASFIVRVLKHNLYELHFGDRFHLITIGNAGTLTELRTDR